MQVSLLTVHGMGGDKSTSHKKIVSNIKKHLGKDIDLVVYPVQFYAKIQANQDSFMERLGSIGYKFIRRYFISSFGDVGTIGYNSSEYQRTIQLIKTGVDSLNQRTDNAPMIVIAQSFGCQMFSSYMWDTKDYEGNKTIERLFTAGCNIPIFISGLTQEEIHPIGKPNIKFKWINFWFSNDLLGYPLELINTAYKSLVEDVKVRSFFPIISHTRYDVNRKVYKRIAKEINEL